LSAVIWDFEPPVQKISNRPFYTKVVPSHPAEPVQLQVMHLVPDSSYRLEVHRTGFHANDAYSAYLEMGSPKDLNSGQIDHLNDLTRDAPEQEQIVRAGSDGKAEINLTMSSNNILLVTLQPATTKEANGKR
jgi:xylan 1,4-beta-xylosidase